MNVGGVFKQSNSTLSQKAAPLSYFQSDFRKLDGCLATLWLRMNQKMFYVLFHFILKGLNCLSIYLTFLDRFSIFVWHIFMLSIEKVCWFWSMAAFSTFNLIFNLQSFLRRICFWSFVGWCILQFWCKILPKTTMLCAFYPSDWSKDFNPQHIIQRWNLWHYNFCFKGYDSQGTTRHMFDAFSVHYDNMHLISLSLSLSCHIVYYLAFEDGILFVRRMWTTVREFDFWSNSLLYFAHVWCK